MTSYLCLSNGCDEQVIEFDVWHLSGFFPPLGGGGVVVFVLTELILYCLVLCVNSVVPFGVFVWDIDGSLSPRSAGCDSCAMRPAS